MLKHYLANKAGVPVEINEDAGENTGLVVATRDHKTYTPKAVFFTNDAYGREMAQNAAYGGSPVLIHNGIDDVAWTMSQPVGTKWVANSADRPYAGSTSMYCNRVAVGAVMQVINNLGPGNNIDLSGYTALTMWINVGSNWFVNDSFSIYGYLTDGTPAQVGDKVYLEDYFDYDTYDTYHYLSIPLTDMGLESATIDSFRIECEAVQGTKARFYVDNWNLEESGAPIDYTVEPAKGTWFHIKAFQTTFVDNGAFTDAVKPPYDQILSMTPTEGYIYKRYSKGNSEPIYEARITNLLDLLSYPYSSITNYLPDGTDTLLTITNEYPEGISFILKAEDLDKIVYTLDDNFSDLLYFRICVHGYEEVR